MVVSSLGKIAGAPESERVPASKESAESAGEDS